MYPWWAYGIGWFLTVSSLSLIPINMIYKLYKGKGTFWEVGVVKKILKILMSGNVSETFNRTSRQQLFHNRNEFLSFPMDWNVIGISEKCFVCVALSVSRWHALQQRIYLSLRDPRHIIILCHPVQTEKRPQTTFNVQLPLRQLYLYIK